MDHSALGLLLQTNASEAHEFIQVYLFSKAFVGTFLFMSFIGLIEYSAVKYAGNFHFTRFSFVKAGITLLFFIGLFMFSGLLKIAVEPDGLIGYNLACNKKYRLSGYPLVEGAIAYKTVKKNLNKGKILAMHIRDTRVDAVTAHQGNIILIIGESHIKKHSSLYGYPLPTNPLMEKEKDNLYIFNDVITPINSTNQVFEEILSVSSTNDSTEWNCATLFPAVFKASEWNVVLSSNQFTDEPSKNIWDAAIDAFLNVPEISEACFTSRNNRTYTFDGEMVDSLIIHRKEGADSARATLTIINLLGQHVGYTYRCPDDKRFFQASHYNHRAELSNRQKQDVADYDNACRYNDEQIYKLIQSYKEEDAIIIYMSDHGDEVHDYRKHMGRAHDLAENAPMSYHYQIDVPFFIYATDKYKENHPKIVRQIEHAINRPFMTDDICHLLFYLGDIHTGWFDKTKCLIHDSYNIHQPRVLRNGDNYGIMTGK